LDGVFVLGFENLHFFGWLADIPQVGLSRLAAASQQMSVGGPGEAVDAGTRFQR